MPAIMAYAVNDPRLNVQGGTRRGGAIEVFQNKLALKATYPAGGIGGASSDLNLVIAPSQFFPAREVWFAFRWFVDPNFPWTPSDVKKSAGKILGFKIGTGEASGGNYSRTGATYRVVWHHDGGIGPYMYPQAASASNLDQSDEVKAVWKVQMGMHLFPGRLWLRRNAWNDVAMYCKLNTPGKKDGVVKLTVNGQSVVLRSFRYLLAGSKAAINGVMLQTFFGGGSSEYAPPRATHSWFSDFRFAKTDPLP